MRLRDAVKAAQPYADKLASGELKPMPPIARPVTPALPVMDPSDGGLNAFQKLPLPSTAAAPDAARQFYRSGIPQRRVLGLPPLGS